MVMSNSVKSLHLVIDKSYEISLFLLTSGAQFLRVNIAVPVLDIFHTMNTITLDPNNPGRISLAYRELTELPPGWNSKYGEITVLDLSHNNLTDFHFLQDFSHLNTLILDNNDLTNHVKFPFMESLHTLWVNQNKITNLSAFIETVAKCFPNLKYYSMMNNEAAPSYFNGGTYHQYKDYRCYVISHLPGLLVLDDHTITAEEREEARQVYGNRRLSVSSKRPSKKHKEKRKKTAE